MSKQNRDSKDFVKLEYSVLDLTEYNGLTINGNMKILLSLVYSYDKTGRTYYESVGTIGKRCGCKPEAVRNFRNKLREAGMITFEEVKGSTHKISPVELDPSLMVFLDDHNSAQASNRKVETEESGKNEQKPVVESFVVESAAPVTGKPDGVPAVDIPVDVDLSNSDDPSLSESAGENVVGIPWLANSFTSRGDLVPEARRWAQSHGATTWQDEIKLVWKLKGKTNMGEPGEQMRPDDIPATEPAPVKQQVNGPDVYHYDEDDPEIPF
ncbi:TPA: helix-turn-helix domain-containing protein [Citrobacter amalonaticus]|nr:helix-turn-helix domain-containing protein [Escherichia coli]